MESNCFIRKAHLLLIVILEMVKKNIIILLDTMNSYLRNVDSPLLFLVYLTYITMHKTTMPLYYSSILKPFGAGGWVEIFHNGSA